MVNKSSKDMNIIGVIHARGGSKRIPMKNIAPLNKKPLISYMIKAALASKRMKRVIVSTDHPEIKRIALECGAEVPFMRPAKLAEDCPSEWVTQHAVEFVEAEEGRKVDMAVTMQPTTPFCTGADIDACIEMLLSRNDLTSTFSVKVIHERPEWMHLLKNDNRAELFLKGEIKGDRGIFQALPKLVMANGGIFVTRRDTLFNDDIIMSKDIGAYVMPPERSVDIDEMIDLEFAEFLIEKGKVQNE